MRRLTFSIMFLMLCHFGNLQADNSTGLEESKFLSTIRDCKIKLKEIICALSPLRGLKQFFNKCYMKVHNYFNPKDQYRIVELERCKNYTPPRYEPKGDANEVSVQTHSRLPYGSAFSSSKSSS